MKTVIAAATLAAFVLAAPAAHAKSGDWLPDKTMIARMEAVLKMPKGAIPLGAFDRFYTGVMVGKDGVPGHVPTGHRVIWAEYVLPNMHSMLPGLHIVPWDGMPSIDDGGCSVVNAYYDVETARVAYIACNGYA